MKRIGVLSDTHWRRVEHVNREVLNLLKGVDLILHAGDLTELFVLDILQGIAPVEAVCGNCDGWDTSRVLPSKRVITVEGKKIGLVHGWRRNEGHLLELAREFVGVCAIIFGHFHIPVQTEKDGILFFNPGSASFNRAGPSGTMAFMEVGEKIHWCLVSL